MAPTVDRSQQMNEYKASKKETDVLTMSNGAPIYNKNAVLTVGPRGPMLLQDIVYMDEMGHFDRERIPERVVHAKGGGAHGYFEVTSKDITKYSKAALFSEVGKRTPLFMVESVMHIRQLCSPGQYHGAYKDIENVFSGDMWTNYNFVYKKLQPNDINLNKI